MQSDSRSRWWSEQSAKSLFTVHCSLTTEQLLLDDAEDFFLAHDQELLTVDLDFGAGILDKENLVAGVVVEGRSLALVVRLSVADRDDLAFLRLLFCAVGDDDATTDRFTLFQTADEDTIVEVRKVCGNGCCCHFFASPSHAEGWKPSAELVGFVGKSFRKNRPSTRGRSAG